MKTKGEKETIKAESKIETKVEEVKVEEVKKKSKGEEAKTE